MNQSAVDARSALDARNSAFDDLTASHAGLVAANATLSADAEIAKGTLMERSLLTNIMDSLIRTIPKEDSAVFQLDQLHNKDMSSRDLMNAAGQVLMCCNASMMKSRVSGGGGSPKKRVREEVVEAEETTGSPLSRAIAATWSM
jgi:hypothetical protein